MIRVENVHKVYRTQFGANHVLKGVSFRLQKGEKLGILGRNGAGKSTLLRLVSGAELPTAGVVDRGISVSWPLAFGGAFQLNLTGRDNVRFISRIYQQDFERNIAFVEDFSELGPYLGEPVRSYSSGMRARLAFAISMIIEFDCFLIDEVGAVGDARFHDKCNYELFEKRADRAMILISHDASYVRDHCNRYAVLNDGHLNLFDDFDTAYDRFTENIGLARPKPAASINFRRRTAALDTQRRLALADDRFRVAVQRGDWARDQRDWAAAELHYGAALARHPYERSYWTQFGHVSREAGKAAQAEIAYRTACALGEPGGPVLKFLDMAMEALNLPTADWPPVGPDQGEIWDQPAGFPDLALLGRLLWGQQYWDIDDGAAMLREHKSMDDLAHHMMTDIRATEARVISAELPVSMVPGSQVTHPQWLGDVARLTGVDAELADSLPKGQEPLRQLLDAGAFKGWPKSSPRLLDMLPRDALF